MAHGFGLPRKLANVTGHKLLGVCRSQVRNSYSEALSLPLAVMVTVGNVISCMLRVEYEIPAG
jgi:hypothetical protein